MNWSNVEWKTLAQGFNTAGQNSNQGSPSQEFEAIPPSHCALLSHYFDDETGDQPTIQRVVMSGPMSDNLERLGAPSDSLLAVHSRRMVRINHPELKLLQQSRYEEEQLGLGENLSETHATPYNTDTACTRQELVGNGTGISGVTVYYVGKVYLYTGELFQHDISFEKDEMFT